MSEWLEDFIVAFLQSPPWRVPIDSFIDENCIVFDNEEECKFEYTTIHKNFQDLIEKLLEEYLEDLGVSPEEFVKAIEGASSRNEVVTQMIHGEILATDDFLTFRKMMAARNAALEVSAIKQIQEMVTNPENTNDTRELAKTLDPDAEEGEFDEAQFLAAMKASVADEEVLTLEAASEQAELEAAIQMSLAFETERLEKIKIASEAEEEAHKETENLKKAKDTKKAEEAGKREAAAKAEKERLMIQEAQFLKAQNEPAPPATSSPAPAAAPAEEKTPSVLSPKSRGTLLGALPSFDELAKNNKHKVQQAEQAFEKNRKARKEKKRERKKALKEKAKVSEEELARRKQFFEKQKELFVAKAQKERDVLLTDYKEKVYNPAVKKAEAEAPRPKPKAEEKKAAPKAVEAPMTAEEEAEQEKRQAFRSILSSEFKRFERGKETQANQKTHNFTAQLDRVNQLQQQIESQEEGLLLAQEQQRATELRAFHNSIRN